MKIQNYRITLNRAAFRAAGTLALGIAIAGAVPYAVGRLLLAAGLWYFATAPGENNLGLPAALDIAMAGVGAIIAVTVAAGVLRVLLSIVFDIEEVES
jgi:hypothetical protein